MAPPATASRTTRVEQVAGSGVETGVGFVEQPHLGPAHHQAGQRGAAALTGGELGHRQAGASRRAMAEPVEGGVHVGRGPRPSSGPRTARSPRYGQLAVQAVGVAEVAHPPPHLTALAAQIEAQDGRLTLRRGGQQAGAQAEQRRLARAVGPGHQHDLAPSGPRRGRHPARAGKRPRTATTPRREITGSMRREQRYPSRCG